MGAFLCIARNEVPPTVSKRIVLNVNCKHYIFFLRHFSAREKTKTHKKILTKKMIFKHF